MSDFDEKLVVSAREARESGAKWLLRAEVRSHIPLLFDQPRELYFPIEGLDGARRLIAKTYRIENGYHATIIDLHNEDVENINFMKAHAFGLLRAYEDSDMRRMPERICVLPFNRMVDIHAHMKPLASRELKYALAYEYHRRCHSGRFTSVEDLLQEVIERGGPAGSYDLVDARSADKSITKNAPEKIIWTRFDLDDNTRRHMIALDDPKMPYYESYTSFDGEIYRLHFVVPGSLGDHEYRERIDEWSVHGIGPYDGNERLAIDTDAQKRGLPPLNM